ncbi:replication factor A protein 3-domain-containing protein [Catenaria anguillulae PL171]|uniref:Replication factor A protein 3-domain-containing protein n=1 Tax=Catenaria anguillulae PL171 TaxID=765915 RepID=A0A1Y2HAC1_9FUNG|nr:replication factor A protein 3-domain-containing protein [Catenaria anguillulae PL171]
MSATTTYQLESASSSTMTTSSDPSSCLRVNSGMLQQFVGKTVLLPGKVLSISGMQATIQAADQGQVIVHLNQTVPPTAQFVEIRGTAEADGSVRMVEYKEWPDTVDMTLLNEMIRIQFPNSHLFQQA